MRRFFLVLALASLGGCRHAAPPPAEPAFPLGAAATLEEVRQVFADRGLILVPTGTPNVFATQPVTEVYRQHDEEERFNLLVEKRSWIVVLGATGDGKTRVQIFRATQDDWSGSAANLAQIPGGASALRLRAKVLHESVATSERTLKREPIQEKPPRDTLMEGEVAERIASLTSVEITGEPEPGPAGAPLGFSGLAAAAKVPAACGVDASAVEAFFQAGHVLLLGEQHGTVEEPELAGGVACTALQRGQKVLLGLSVPGTEQQAINAYLESAGRPADREALLRHRFWRRPFADGRSSEAVVALIERARQLRASGQPISVLAFDAEGRKGNIRTALAAQRIEAVRRDHPEAFTLLLGGNVTMARAPVPLAGAWFEPVGFRLARSKPGEVLSFDMRFEGGEHWSCRDEQRSTPSCGTFPLLRTAEVHRAVPESGPPRLVRFGRLVAGIDGFIQIPRGTPSPPAQPERARGAN